MWVDDPAEFARSLQVESANGDPRLIAIRSIVGGSSKLVINLIMVDDRNRQYIQPIALIKRSSPQNITQFVDRLLAGWRSVSGNRTNKSSNLSIVVKIHQRGISNGTR
jgi:hypothetical protein